VVAVLVPVLVLFDFDLHLDFFVVSVQVLFQDQELFHPQLAFQAPLQTKGHGQKAELSLKVVALHEVSLVSLEQL